MNSTDDLFGFFENLLNVSRNMPGAFKRPRGTPGWKKCLDLEEDGWTECGYRPVSKNSYKVMIIFEKEGEEDKEEVSMDLNDQARWASILEKRYKKSKENNKEDNDVDGT